MYRVEGIRKITASSLMQKHVKDVMYYKKKKAKEDIQKMFGEILDSKINQN